MLTNRLAAALAGASLTAFAVCVSHPAHAQEAAPSPGLPPGTQALVAEIEAWGQTDQSRDPEGDLVKLADLAKRVEADGKVPPMDRGLLASAIGAAHFYARRYDEAADEYGKAAILFEEGHAPPEEMAGLYNNQASILASIGRYAEAEQSHRKALAIRKQMEGERGPKVASSLFGIGYVYYRQGRVEESIPYFRESVEQQLEFVGPEDPQTIMRLTSLASVLGRSGRTAEALQVARQAEELGRQYLGDDHPTYAIALNNLGNALVENGLFAEAVPVLREALRVRQRTVGEDASGTALSLRNLATALKETGSVAEAEELNRQALAIYEKTGEVETPFALAYMYAELADFAADRGDWENYLALAGKAIGEADAKLDADNYDRAYIHLLHAQRLSEHGEDAAALPIAEQWVPVIEAALIPRHKDRIWAELLLARLRQQQGSAEVWPLADQAIAELSAKLSDISVTDRSLVREAQSNRESAMFYFQIALAANDRERAFAALQLANISDLAVGQQFATDNEGSEDGAALEARRKLLDLARRTEEMRTRYNSSLEDGDAEATERLSAELARLETERGGAEATLREKFPDFVALYRPKPVDLASFVSALGEKDILVAPVEGTGQGWIVTITRKGLAWHAVDPAETGREVAAIRRAVEMPAASPEGFPYREAHALFEALFPQGVKRGSRILFHGGGALASLPLSLLVTRDYRGSAKDAPWLVRDASFEVLGNLELHGRQQAGRTKLAGAVMAGIGGPELPGAERPETALAALFRSGRPAAETIADLPPLPNAAKELGEIADALPGARHMLLVGRDAAEENFKAADLGEANIIVFATHGLVAGELRDLWEPALLLGTNSPESGEDGLLGASEIARLKLKADWVILSACNTSAGDKAGSPVFSGLATAFAQAGAGTLMLSHWRVRDDAASFLTVETVKGAAQGLDRGEALRRAQLELIGNRDLADAANPATWAPFVIVEN